MKVLGNYIIENWETGLGLSTVAYELIARAVPTEKNRSIIDLIFRIISTLIKNRRKPMVEDVPVQNDPEFNRVIVDRKKHIVFTLLMLLSFASYSQVNGTFRAIRSFNADSLTVRAETVGLQLMYDSVGVIFFNPQASPARFQCYTPADGWYDCLIRGTGGVTTPAPPAFSIQYNDAGAFGGDSDFLVDPTNSALLIGPNRLFASGVSNSSMFLGENAGNFTNTSNGTIGIGRNTLSSVTTAFHDVIIGIESGQLITTGQRNIVVGTRAFQANVVGTDNIAIGDGTLNANVVNQNIAIGTNALNINTTSSGNVNIGHSSGAVNVTGVGMTAVGYNTLSQSTGTGNTAIGFGTLSSVNTGDFNTAVGSSVGTSLTTGTRNVMIGDNGFGSMTTGSQNVGIGTNSLYNNVSGQGNIAIGYRAGEAWTGSNALFIDNSQTVDPLIGGDFSARFVDFNANEIRLNGVAPASPSTEFFAADMTWKVPAGGSPAGATTNIQYNNAGAFGAEAAFSYNSGTNVLTVDGIRSNAATSIFMQGNTSMSLASLSGATNISATNGNLNIATTSATFDVNITSTDEIVLTADDADLIFNSDNVGSGDIRLQVSSGGGRYWFVEGLPTTCAGAPTNSVANVGGTLTVCP